MVRNDFDDRYANLLEWVLAMSEDATDSVDGNDAAEDRLDDSLAYLQANFHGIVFGTITSRQIDDVIVEKPLLPYWYQTQLWSILGIYEDAIDSQRVQRARVRARVALSQLRKDALDARKILRSLYKNRTRNT